MFMQGHSWVVYGVWMTLAAAFLYALGAGNWAMAFVAAVTLCACLVPAFVVDRYHVRVPLTFFAGLVLFIFAALFLGEALDFYERFAWWDVALHGAAGLGFGMVGVILALVMFEGDRYAAPAWALASIAFAFALSIGALWEVFEFMMDWGFGLNMQKSGLVDTMTDLIVDTIGAFVGAASGYAYLRGRSRRGLAGMIAEFVRRNRGFFRGPGRRG